MPGSSEYDVVIIGSGPAGYTAALYCGRANLKTLVLAGALHGGQLTLTTMVENYPGFPEGVMGSDLMDKMREQAKKYSEIINEDVVSVDFSSRPFSVSTSNKTYKAKSVIIATGASTKWLGLESEARLRGRGVSSCAVCDAFFFKGKEVVVVGGGDTAIEDALFLTKFATKITVIHRRVALRASKIMQDRVFAEKKISFVWNSEVTEILGKDKVEGVKIKDVSTEKESAISCGGVFVAIGHTPNTEIFKGQIELDELGYVKTRNGTKTNIEGVFVAGDVHDSRYKQAVTAAGFGCQAAIDVGKYLESKK